MSKEKINKKMKFGEVIQKYPKTTEVFMKYGMHCVGCHIAAFESIEDGCKAHGFDGKKLKKLLKELNEVAEEKDSYDEKDLDEFSGYDEDAGGERNTQKGKTRHSPYKRGGGGRSKNIKK